MRISDWSSDVCSSDLNSRRGRYICVSTRRSRRARSIARSCGAASRRPHSANYGNGGKIRDIVEGPHVRTCRPTQSGRNVRSEEHTSELQSLMRISYAVFCLKQKKHEKQQQLTK